MHKIFIFISDSLEILADNPAFFEVEVTNNFLHYCLYTECSILMSYLKSPSYQI
jgi:hypothetical protein